MTSQAQSTAEESTAQDWACTVCGAATRAGVAAPPSSYGERGTYAVRTCTRCGMGVTAPMPSQAELDAFYGKDYGYDAHTLIATEKRWRARQLLRTAMPHPVDRLLDVGCMYGFLLEEAKRLGVTHTAGVELSKKPAEDARAAGHEVFHGMLEDYAASGAPKVNLLFAQHVLEHVSDLDSFMKTAHEMLEPGGKLCICVPNFGSRTRRTAPNSWGWYQVPVHLHHFNRESLEMLVGRHDFDIERVVTRGGDTLFVAMTILNAIGKPPSSDTASPTPAQAAALGLAGRALRSYYFIGDDELVLVAKRRG